MCPNTEFFLVRIQSECGKIRTRKNSVFGHFSRSEEVVYSPRFSEHLVIFFYQVINEKIRVGLYEENAYNLVSFSMIG